MNEDRKMIISVKGYTEAVKQMQDLSHHIKTVYYNQCIAGEYKSYWKTRCAHYEIDWSSNSAVLDSIPALMWGKCKSCGLENYYSIEEANNESQYFTC